MKHPHAELMLQYAQDAMTTDKPWELWEFQCNPGGAWSGLSSSPEWIVNYTYRYKQPKKKQIKLLAYLTSLDKLDWYAEYIQVTNGAYRRIPALDYQVEIEE